jgi:16S rRNA G966 N2-methylase RsmD
MKKFTIYFEFYGRNMKATVLSDNEENAKKQLKNNIIFHKIEKESEFFDDFMDILNGKKK